MGKSYTISKSFVKKIEFNTPGAVANLETTSSATNIETHISTRNHQIESNTYLLDICATVERSVSAKSNIDSLEVVYSAIVEFDSDVVDSERTIMLAVDIPQSLYNKVRNLVYNLTAESSLEAVMLPAHCFESAEQKEFSFRTALMNIGNREDFSSVWDIYSCHTENAYDYADSPIYRHGLKFFIPVDYAHPTFEGCDESWWDMLLQLLYINPQAKCQLVDKGGEVPELIFDYGTISQVPVSAIGPDDSKVLTTCLLADAFAMMGAHILNNHIDQDFSAKIGDYQKLKLKDLQRLYGCGKATDSRLEAFVEQLYQKISNYYLQVERLKK